MALQGFIYDTFSLNGTGQVVEVEIESLKQNLL